MTELSKLWLRRLLVLAALVLVAIGGMELYTRTPESVITPDLQVSASATRLVIVVHGSMDADNPQFPVMLERLRDRYAADPGTQVRFLRWEPWANVRLRAAASAQLLGNRLGMELAALPALADLQLIVHSSGAYVADALCESYRQNAGLPARIEMVFLDAFQIDGFLDWSHGARTHGRCADFAMAIFNTDDPAPASNRPLQHAYNLDVTGLPVPAGFSRNGHYWPVEYYLEALLHQGLLPQIADHAIYPRGQVVMASPLPAGIALSAPVVAPVAGRTL